MFFFKSTQSKAAKSFIWKIFWAKLKICVPIIFFVEWYFAAVNRKIAFFAFIPNFLTRVVALHDRPSVTLMYAW